MVERAPPLAVNAAVAFVDDDQIEIAGRIFFVFVHQRLQRDDRDPLLVLKAAADARHAIAGQMRQVLGEGVFGLNGERVAVDDEQCAGRPIRLEQALHQCGGHAGLAGAGRHLDEHLPAPVDDLAAKDVDAGGLVQAPAAPGNSAIDRDVERVAADVRERPCAGQDRPG